MPPKKIFLQKKKHKHYNTSFRGISGFGGTSAAPEENQTHGALCFFLGLLLGPLGVIAAAVVSKAAGARFALSGFGLWIFIWLFFFR